MCQGMLTLLMLLFGHRCDECREVEWKTRPLHAGKARYAAAEGRLQNDGNVRTITTQPFIPRAPTLAADTDLPRLYAGAPHIDTLDVPDVHGWKHSSGQTANYTSPNLMQPQHQHHFDYNCK